MGFYFSQCSMFLLEIQDRESRDKGNLKAGSLVYNSSMPGCFRKLRGLAGHLVGLVSLFVFAWGVWPLDDTAESLSLPDGGQLLLTWPETIRAGDSRLIRLQIDAGPPGISESKAAALASGSGRGGAASGGAASGGAASGGAASGGAAPVGEGGTNHLAAARLEFAGLLYTPADIVSQPLIQGKPVAFHWQVRPDGRGVYKGVVWLYFHSVPLDGGPESSRPVSAQEIEIRSIDFFGLSGMAARVSGGAGLLVGLLLILEGIWNWLRISGRWRPPHSNTVSKDQ
jgi:hypothetical protein